MASTNEYRDYVLEQLSGAEGISCRKMMGEFIIYCEGKVIGGIYDDRFLIKPTPAAKRLMPDAPMELPYEGAKKMPLVTVLDDREKLSELVRLTAQSLPSPKRKK